MKWLLLILISLTLLAKTSEEEAAEKVYIANINALLIFTSESGLSSGKYSLTNTGHSIETYSVPFSYHFKPYTKELNFFINGSSGFSRTRLELPPKSELTRSGNDLNLTLDNKIQTYAFGVGGGVRYKVDEGIELLASAGLIYSRVGVSVKPDNPGEIVEGAFDSAYNDNLTYKFMLSGKYQKEFHHYKPYLKLDIKSYETKSELDFSSLLNISTQSSVASFAMGCESLSLYEHGDDYLSLEAYLRGNYLFGDIVEVVDLYRYANFGLIGYWNTPDLPSWAERFYLEVSTVRAEGLEGYNVGIGFSLDY